ncbi:MAG: C-terminal binding protein, partial [Rhodospirillaceae bacterium]|nr:C-terminal binding protein [Rhodospirillaceae bacterium]
HRLRGSVMGIVSFGRIGRAIAARAAPFGLQVIVYDPYVGDDVLRAHGVTRAAKDELMERSDYIMMQAPLTTETRHFIAEPELRRMKPRTIIVNTGRGPTIDNRALYLALKEGWIAGAALDDTEEEPAHRRAWSPADNPLFTLDNVLITPHSAYYSEESIRLCREVAAGEVVRVLTGQRPLNPVNRVRLADGSWSLPEGVAP